MKTKFLRFVSIILGIYFINISVDVIEPLGGSIPEDSHLNIQESILELILEKYLNLGDVVEETQDDSNNEHRNQSLKKLDIFKCSIIMQFSLKIEEILAQINYPEKAGKCIEGYGSICNPPPEMKLA